MALFLAANNRNKGKRPSTPSNVAVLFPVRLRPDASLMSGFEPFQNLCRCCVTPAAARSSSNPATDADTSTNVKMRHTAAEKGRVRVLSRAHVECEVQKRTAQCARNGHDLHARFSS